MDVVITGLGATTPLGGDVDSLWQGLLAGRSGVRAIEVAEDMPTKIAAPMAVSPDTRLDRVRARRMDRCQQAALVAAREAWAGAGAPEVDPLRLAVAVGTGIGGVMTMFAQDDILEAKGVRKVSPLTIPMVMPNGPAAWVSLEFRARAGVYTPVSACASGAEALALAARLILAGDADVVIAGGAECAITPLMLAGFSQARTLSKRNDEPERASRPFDTARDGFVIGEGAGIMVLESEAFAAGRGARVIGRLAGYGITSDAYHITGPDPTGAGQVRAMLAAVSRAGLTPADVPHVNCHATSTVVGDAAEAVAIREALGPDVVLTAPKSSFGHLVGAAGAVESIITLLSVVHGIVPPTLNLDEKDPAIPFDVVSGAPREQHLDAAMCNSFGFGGQNASLVFTR